MKLANYDESILSIAASILKHYHLETNHQSLKAFDTALQAHKENVVVMLFDGLGISLLERHLPKNAFLRKNLKQTISSVFPPTTVAATTSIQTGLAPIEHGKLGWHLYYEEVNDNVTAFTNLKKTDNSFATDKHLTNTYFPTTFIGELISQHNKDVANYFVSPFATTKATNCLDVCLTTLKLTKQQGKKYIHTYWINPDYFAHKYGVNSLQVKISIFYINFLVKFIASRMKNTTLVITADHSLIDTKYFYLEDYPDLCALLKHDVSLETRCAAFFLKEGKTNEFEKLFHKYFDDHFYLITAKQALDLKIFGEGQVNEKCLPFMGDYLAISKDVYNIVYHKTNNLPFGHHAGGCLEEFEVPFILIEK